MSLIIVRMKMASSQTSTVWFTGSSPLASDDRREQGVHVEQDEVLVCADADRSHQTGVNTRKIPAFHHRGRGDLEEVQDLPYAESVIASLHFKDDNRSFIGMTALLLQQEVPVENGEQAAPDVYQPFDGIRNTRNSGSRKAREDLTHDPCRGRADNLTDSKDDGVERGGVSHLY
jgi:hypothetical protein